MSEYYGVSTPTDDFLAHYGVKGMKWGVRKAVAKGSDRALGRQYRKASRKLAKLERQAANGKKYAKRAAALGVGAAAAGGLAAVGTKGVAKGIAKAGSLAAKVDSRVGAALSKSKNAKISSAGKFLASNAERIGAGSGKVAGAVSKWGNSNNIASKANNALGGVKNGTVQEIRKRLPSNVSNNTIARIGAGAVGAGLAAGAGYNAYRAATTKRAAKKAAEFRSEMNKAFAGTKYANGNPNTKNKSSAKKSSKRLNKSDFKDALKSAALSTVMGPGAAMYVQSRKAANSVKSGNSGNKRKKSRA